jgi:hypothetical protein
LTQLQITNDAKYLMGDPSRGVWAGSSVRWRLRWYCRGDRNQVISTSHTRCHRSTRWGWALARGRDRACRALGGGRRGQATFSDYGRPIPRPESSPRSGRCCGRYICRRPRPPRGIPIGQVMARRHCLGARGDVRRSPAPFPSPRSALQASHPSPPDPVSSRLTFDRGAGLLSRTGPCDDDTTNNVSWP